MSSPDSSPARNNRGQASLCLVGRSADQAIISWRTFIEFASSFQQPNREALAGPISYSWDTALKVRFSWNVLLILHRTLLTFSSQSNYLSFIRNEKSAWRLESRELPVLVNRRCHRRFRGTDRENDRKY